MNAIDLDFVSETLASVRLRMGALATFHLTEPWGVDVPALGPAFFYAVTEGAAVVDAPGVARTEAFAGDVFLMPGGDPVQLRSASGVRAAPLEEVFDAGARPLGAGQTRAPAGDRSFRRRRKADVHLGHAHGVR